MGDPAKITDLELIFGRIISLASYFALFVAFIMLLIGGFRYLTSGGDPKKAEEAKNTITYAIFGLLVLVGIWFLLKFIKSFTGIDVTLFQIPTN